MYLRLNYTLPSEICRVLSLSYPHGNKAAVIQLHYNYNPTKCKLTTWRHKSSLVRVICPRPDGPLDTEVWPVSRP